ncbi:portal protein [Sphingopyxis sp. 22461]|uniref:portal protein n=1 Tax=Sphingopyxis sp. 22461 TaxID=3453923 RepID=UPI003F87E31E
MKPEPLDEDELVNALKNEADSACTFHDTALAERQEQCLKYYDGDLFGDEVEGLSQIVVKDVQETVDYMTISVLRTFVAGDRVVEFQAKSPEEEEAVDQATETIQQIFMQHQDGYRVLHDWLKAGLIEIIGVVKSAVIEEDAVDEQVFEASAEEIAAADERGEVPEDAEIIDNGDGSFRVTVKRATKRRYFCDYTVPSEEFRFSARTRHEDKADYLAHVCRKTRSDLVEMGFDVDTIYDLPTGDDTLWTDGRSQERDEGFDRGWSDTRQASMQELELWEEYIRIDADGDGIAELLKCFRVGDRLLGDPEIVTDHPFTVFCPFPRPHRMVGDSLAEKAMDIQRIRSVVARQLMNGMYLSNMPRYWVPTESTTENTINDLLTVIPGAPVRGKGAAPQALNDGFDIGKSLGVLEFWSGEKESRTGITRMNQGLDADALNKTATGTALMQAQGQQYEEFIARNFAECVGRMFWRKYRLVKDAGEPFTVKVGGSYAEVDPSRWPDEPDLIIRTGLGTNRKEYRIAQRMQLLEIQREGLEIGLVDKQRLFNSAAGLVRDMGIGQPDDYFTDPKNAPPEEPKPDPEMVKAQMDAQAQQAKIEGEQQLSAIRIQGQREEAAAKQQLAREEAEFQAQLAREKFEFEKEQSRDRMMFEASMAREQAALKAQTAVEVSKNRPGGDLDK